MPDSKQARAEPTNARNCNAFKIMNVEWASSFESLVNYMNDETATMQKMVSISDLLVAVSHQLLTKGKSIAAMDQISYCRDSLDLAQTTSKCPPITNAEDFIHAPNRNSHNNPSGHTNDRSNGRPPMGL